MLSAIAFTCVVEFASQITKKSQTASPMSRRSIVVMCSPFLSLMALMMTSIAGGMEGCCRGCFFFTFSALIVLQNF
jgi:hypothetical protein